MDDELVRVESAVTATASGNLTWDRWPLDCAVALGLSGVRNPLGFAVVRYLADTPSSINIWNIVLCLAKSMQKRGVAGTDIQIKDAAFSAFEIWRDARCPKCGGRGQMPSEPRPCDACGGTGKRTSTTASEIVRIGLSCLLEAEQWMEGQLRSRM